MDADLETRVQAMLDRDEIAALEQGPLVGVPGLFQVPHELGDARGHGYRPTQIPNGPGFRPASL